MRTIIASLVFITSLLDAPCATWTVHAFRDNYALVQVVGPIQVWPDNIADRVWWYAVQWDYNWDQLFPSQTDSGVQEWKFVGDEYTGTYQQSTVFAGYQDTFVLQDDTPQGVTPIEFNMTIGASLTGPAPDYSFNPSAPGAGSWSVYAEVTNSMEGGEWWIDFAPDGSARISTTVPDDFGKWAWDGSVNPNYVPPLVLSHKKQHKHLHSP